MQARTWAVCLAHDCILCALDEAGHFYCLVQPTKYADAQAAKRREGGVKFSISDFSQSCLI